MGQRVRFPGVAGNYLETEDINLLDADTAHMQQSVGQWAGGTTGGLPELVATPPLPPPFGVTCLKTTKTAATGSEMTLRNIGGNGDRVGVSPSTEYVSGMWVYVDTTADLSGNTEARVGWEGATAGGGYVASYIGVYGPINGQQWHFVSHAGVGAANVELASLYLRLPDEVPVGTDVYVAAAVFRAGSDATFVPSLRIVNDLDLEIDFTLPPDFTPATNMEIFGTWDFSNGGYALRNPNADGLALAVRESDGTNNYPFASTANLGIGGRESERATIKATLDVSDTATGVKWYVDQGLAFTSGHAIADIAPGGPLQVGRTPALAPGGDYVGNVYSAVVRDGIGGPIVAKFDANELKIDGKTSLAPDEQFLSGGRLWTARGSSPIPVRFGHNNRQIVMLR